MMKKIIITLMIVILPSICIASVSDINGSTITGSSFGTKTTAAPTTWDNFEDGVCDTTPTVGSVWQSVQDLTISTLNNRGSSSYTATHNFTNWASAGPIGNNSNLSRKWFIQYWVYLDENWDWGTSVYSGGDQHLANVKFMRMWNPGDVNENWLTIFNITNVDGNSSHYYENITGATNNYFDTTFSKSSITEGTWHCLQFEYLDSSAIGESDGEVRIWFDGALIEEQTGMLGKEDFDVDKRPITIGFFNAWGPEELDIVDKGDNDYYTDDIYIDTTWSRVEVGDNAIYGSCTHREIQIPTAWSDTSISVTYNQGSFADYETVYLFVIDADGDASDGYQGYFLDNTFYPSGTGPVASASSISGAYSITGAASIT